MSCSVPPACSTAALRFSQTCLVWASTLPIPAMLLNLFATKFLISPSTAVQSLMGNYSQQSNQLFAQMQEQMIKAMGLKK
jgi:hypothetical protein